MPASTYSACDSRHSGESANAIDYTILKTTFTYFRFGVSKTKM